MLLFGQLKGYHCVLQINSVSQQPKRIRFQTLQADECAHEKIKILRDYSASKKNIQ